MPDVGGNMCRQESSFVIPRNSLKFKRNLNDKSPHSGCDKTFHKALANVGIFLSVECVLCIEKSHKRKKSRVLKGMNLQAETLHAKCKLLYGCLPAGWKAA